MPKYKVLRNLMVFKAAISKDNPSEKRVYQAKAGEIIETPVPLTRTDGLELIDKEMKTGEIKKKIK